MRVIYNYTPETTRPCKVNTVAVNPWLRFVLNVMLFPMLNVLHFILVISDLCVCVCVCARVRVCVRACSAQYGDFLYFLVFVLSPVCSSGVFC